MRMSSTHKLFSLEEVFANVLSVSSDRLNASADITKLTAWDSMVHIVLITRLEDDFGVQFSGDEIADLRSVNDARRLLRSHGVDA